MWRRCLRFLRPAGATYVLLCVLLQGCTSRPAILAGVQLGMAVNEVTSQLGQPLESIGTDTRVWTSYPNGVLVVFDRRDASSPMSVEYVVQTEGAYGTRQISVGDSVDKIKAELGSRATSGSTGSTIRLKTGKSATDFVFNSGRLSYIRLGPEGGADSRLLPPDTWPAMALAGIALGDAPDRVAEVVGHPVLETRVGDWRVWYYPGRDLAITFSVAQSGGIERVVRVDSARDAYNDKLRPGTSADTLYSFFGVSGSRSGLQFETPSGNRLQFTIEKDKIASIGLQDSATSAEFRGSPKNAAIRAAIGEFRIAGIALGDSEEQVQSVLGVADEAVASQGSNWQTWYYASRGLTLGMDRLNKSEPLTVSRIRLDAGEYSQRLRIGMSQSELETLLGPVLQSMSPDEPARQGIQIIDPSGDTLNILVDDGKVASITLTVKMEP